ncbi:MAG: TerC family protein, partial [Aeromonas sp.]
SGRDLILLCGGLFLIGKSAHEIHVTLEGAAEPESVNKAVSSFISTLVQIAVLDIVFSLDSVITAVGMADHVPVMVLAIMIAVFIMMFSAKAIGDFVEAHPTIKMLALSFLTLVGFALMAEGLDLHIPKGYIYFAMAFSLLVEMINIRLRGHVAANDQKAS